MAKQATLKELVLGAVEGFLATNSKFSVHDVTQSIRQVVNSGAVEVPALFVPGQAFKFEITHDDVKYYFNELYTDSLFSQPLVRQFNGTYFVYEGAPTAPKSLNFANNFPASQASNAANNLAKSLNSLGNASAVVVPSAAQAVQQAAAGKLGRTEVVNRVRLYLQNCATRGVTPTNRRIQSAIKRNGKSTGWTRSDLDQIRVGINSGTI